MKLLRVGCFLLSLVNLFVFFVVLKHPELQTFITSFKPVLYFITIILTIILARNLNKSRILWGILTSVFPFLAPALLAIKSVDSVGGKKNKISELMRAAAEKHKKTLKVMAVLAVIGFIGWNGLLDEKETAAQRVIVNEVKGLVESCRAAGDNVTIVGKALVWDMRSDSPSRVHRRLLTSLRAKSTDKLITVFMVMGERNEEVGTYSVSHQPAYRQYIDIAVALWPDKKPIGFYSLVSAEPRSSRPVQKSPEYGDPNKPIADWIKTLQQAGR